ncbi:ATP adenylyltransferase [cyanobiont of Ornithocercus magnificus]|nr:ATP adenylyltransferase [cyanobiont of Ornithocercus magnificus]
MTPLGFRKLLSSGKFFPFPWTILNTVHNKRLWAKALHRSRTARVQRALIPLTTTIRPLDSASRSFELRCLSGIPPRHLQAAGPKPNPFLPWNPQLAVAPIGNTHVLILNKFPVQTAHMLLITRHWAPQIGWLEISDFAALLEVDRDTQGLWFFNSGPGAGASQPHRHLQLLPRSCEEQICPRASWFEDLLQGRENCGSLAKACAVAYRSINQVCSQTETLYSQYIALACNLGLGDPLYDRQPLHPYNLLLTPTWVALIRRRREGVAGFSVNALGFAGYLLATDCSNLSWLLKRGPENLLQEVV